MRLCSAPGATTSYSPGKGREEPNAEAVPHPPPNHPVITEAPVLLGSGFPRASPRVTAKTSSRPHEFGHSLLLGLRLAGFADSLVPSGARPWRRGLSDAGGDAAPGAEQLGLQQLQHLVFGRCLRSGSARIPPHVSLERFLQSLPQAFRHYVCLPLTQL